MYYFIPLWRTSPACASSRGINNDVRLVAYLAPAIVALIAPYRAAALDPEKKLSQYGLDSWQAKQGVANGGVLSIAQSTDGYLWLGTRRGLVRFNGAEFQIFDRRSSGGLIGFNINHIEPRRDGGILFSTEGGAGLIEFRAGRFSAYPIPALPNRNIRILNQGMATALSSWPANKFIATEYKRGCPATT
jgi:ligand-binding sensor domain-containing protein